MTRQLDIIDRAYLRAMGVDTVERADDNSGTYVANSNTNYVSFIPNSTHVDGLWLYYSLDVRYWLGLPVPDSYVPEYYQDL